MKHKPSFKEEAPQLGGTDRTHDCLQASLSRRSNRVVSIGEVMPAVLSATLAQLALGAKRQQLAGKL